MHAVLVEATRLGFMLIQPSTNVPPQMQLLIMARCSLRLCVCLFGYPEPVSRPSDVDAEKLKAAKMLAKMRLLEDQGGAFARKSLRDLGEHGSDGKSPPLLCAEHQDLDRSLPAALSATVWCDAFARGRPQDLASTTNGESHLLPTERHFQCEAPQ